MVKRAFLILGGVVSVFLVASLAWVFGTAFFGQTPSHLPAKGGASLDNFADWPALYQQQGGDKNYVVGLSYFKGLSDRFTRASGKAVVNFETGQVSVVAKDLPSLEDGSRYEVLLVDNRSGPGNNVALDTGPDGDDIISLGLLDVLGPTTTLEKRLDIKRLRRFEVDMVVVRLVSPDGSTEFVIGGLAALFSAGNQAAAALE